MFEIGSRVGDYKIVGTLGTGGSGRLFKGRHMVTGRVEALKVLQSDHEDAPEFVGRFLREIRVQASLDHPNIASVYSAFQDHGRLVMAMELVEGQNLRQVIDGGKIPYMDALRYTCQALDALGYAHSREITHRDVKPENILITPEGRVKITDFGLAKIWSGVSLTQTSAPLGSLRYMSPEQVRASRKLDGRSDLYSLGVVLYEMVTGQTPFEEINPFDLMKAHVERAPRPPMELAEIPGALNGAILGALRKRPGERYADAAEFKLALERVMADGREPTPAPGTLPRPLLTPVRRKVALATLATLAAAVSVAGFAGVWPSSEPGAEPAIAPPPLAEAARPAPAPVWALQKSSIVHPAVQTDTQTAAAARPVPAPRPPSAKPAPPPRAAVVNSKAPEAAPEPPVETASATAPPPPRQAPAPLVQPKPQPPPAVVEQPALGLVRQWETSRAAERLVFSPDGAMLATYGSNGVQLWDLASGAVTDAGEGRISAVALARGLLFTGNADGTVRILDAKAGRELNILGHGAGVSSLWVSPAGDVIVAALENETLQVWRKTATTGRYERVKRVRGARRALTAVSYSQASGVAAAVSADRQLQLWRTSDGRMTRLQGLERGASAVALSPHDDVVAAAGHGEVGVWSVAGQGRLQLLETGGLYHAIGFLDNGRCVAVAADGAVVSVWDVLSGQRLAQVTAAATVRDVSLNPGAGQVAAVDTAGRVSVWKWNQAAREALAAPAEIEQLAAQQDEDTGERRGPFRRFLDVLR